MMKLVETATLNPRLCACGSAQGPFLDTGRQVQGMRVYICSGCLVEIAAISDYVPLHAQRKLTEQLDEARQLAEERAGQLNTASRRATEVEQRLAALESQLEQARAEARANEQAYVEAQAELEQIRSGRPTIAEVLAAINDTVATNGREN